MGSKYGVEQSIIIATRNEVVPIVPSGVNNNRFDTMDLTGTNLSMQLPQESSLDAPGPPDESCGEESTVGIAELQIAFDGFRLSMYDAWVAVSSPEVYFPELSSRILPPLEGIGAQMSNLLFLPGTAKSSPEHVNPPMHLITCTIEFGNCEFPMRCYKRI
jgi:hypothetical protein